jgi:hypothetical protein
MDRMRQTAAAAAVQPDPAAPTGPVTPAPNAYNFFASQPDPSVPPAAVIQPTAYMPADQQAPITQQAAPALAIAPQPTPTTSENVPSPGIMNLANNAEDLSIETIAREANRINQQDANEVVVSLR